MMFRVPGRPKAVTLDNQPLQQSEFSADNHLFWLRFSNEPRPRELVLQF
jgi:hypothetical protein